MNKVITVNLGGNAYQLEEGAYEALRAYLDSAARQLEKNPDKDEILADIEQAIGDKCRAALGPHKTVVLRGEIETIIAEMGPVEDGSGPEGGEGKPAAPTTAGEQASGAGPARRLYRINDGAMFAGVCNGLAAFFGIDVTLVRLVFAGLTIVTCGGWALVYVLLMFIAPVAGTTAEQAAAHGAPSTAQEFIRRAREGYYEGMRAFGDRRARREWKRRFKREMRGWRSAFREEMRRNVEQWHQNWDRYWTRAPRPTRGLVIALPFFVLLQVAIAFAWFFAILSLLTTGAIFGVLLPAGMPIWVGILLLVLAYSLISWPLRILRHASYYYGPCGPRHILPLMGLWDTIVWLGFLAVLVWLANRYIPEAHRALMNLPPAIHHAADSVRQWWARR